MVEARWRSMRMDFAGEEEKGSGVGLMYQRWVRQPCDITWGGNLRQHRSSVLLTRILPLLLALVSLLLLLVNPHSLYGPLISTASFLIHSSSPTTSAQHICTIACNEFARWCRKHLFCFLREGWWGLKSGFCTWEARWSLSLNHTSRGKKTNKLLIRQKKKEKNLVWLPSCRNHLQRHHGGPYWWSKSDDKHVPQSTI